MAWKPETSNVAYIMPEVGTRAGLYFPTAKEQDAIAIHGMRTEANYLLSENTQKRELSTSGHKKIELYPKNMALKGKEDKVSIALEDEKGISFASNTEQCIQAKGEIRIVGSRITIKAPLDVSLSNKVSNIEIGNSFNFYAPGGVVNTSSENGGVRIEEKVSDENNVRIEYWQSAFLAKAAIPSLDFSKIDTYKSAEFFGKAAIPTIGTGACAINMSEIMMGKEARDTSYPEAMSAMDNYMVSGGYLLPKE